MYLVVKYYTEMIYDLSGNTEDIEVKKQKLYWCDSESEVNEILLEIAEEFGYEVGDDLTEEILQKLDEVVDVVPHEELIRPSEIIQN